MTILKLKILNSFPIKGTYFARFCGKRHNIFFRISRTLTIQRMSRMSITRWILTNNSLTNATYNANCLSYSKTSMKSSFVSIHAFIKAKYLFRLILSTSILLIFASNKIICQVQLIMQKYIFSVDKTNMKMRQ